jgi:hypothetical protein
VLWSKIYDAGNNKKVSLLEGASSTHKELRGPKLGNLNATEETFMQFDIEKTLPDVQHTQRHQTLPLYASKRVSSSSKYISTSFSQTTGSV